MTMTRPFEADNFTEYNRRRRWAESLEVAAHRTPSGRLAINATDGELTTRKYVVGGYGYYVVRVVRSETTWNPKTDTLDKVPSLDIAVVKRTNNADVADREMRLRGGPHTFLIYGASRSVANVTRRRPRG